MCTCCVPGTKQGQSGLGGVHSRCVCGWVQQTRGELTARSHVCLSPDPAGNEHSHTAPLRSLSGQPSPPLAPVSPATAARAGLGCPCPSTLGAPSSTQLLLRAMALSPSSLDARLQAWTLVHGRCWGRSKERREKLISSAPSVFKEQLDGGISGRGRVGRTWEPLHCPTHPEGLPRTTEFKIARL